MLQENCAKTIYVIIQYNCKWVICFKLACEANFLSLCFLFMKTESSCLSRIYLRKENEKTSVVCKPVRIISHTHSCFLWRQQQGLY